MTAPEPRVQPLEGFPRGVTDPLCAHDHVVETPTDRRLLWHLEGVLSVHATTDYQWETGRALRRYLNVTCEHHWHEYDAETDLPAHRQCIWCNDVEWADA